MTVSASVRVIGIEAFCNCKRLKKLVFDAHGKTGARTRRAIGSKIVLPASQLKTICANAFRGCCSLSNVKLPDGLEEIGLYAFCGSGLESVVMPQSVRRVH